MLDARIQPVEFGQLIQRLVSIAGYQCFEMNIYLNDANKIAVSSHGRHMQVHLNRVMVRMPPILRAPIAADQEMLADKITLDCHSIHDASFLLIKSLNSRKSGIGKHELDNFGRIIVQQLVPFGGAANGQAMGDEA